MRSALRIAVTLLGALLTYAGTLATCRAAEGTVLALRDEVFCRLLDLPLDDVHRLSAGDVVVRLTEDVVVLETALSVSVVQVAITVVPLPSVPLLMRLKVRVFDACPATSASRKCRAPPS